MTEFSEMLERDIPLLMRGNYSNASEFFSAIFDKDGWHLIEAVAAEKWLDALDCACDMAENNHIVREALCAEFAMEPDGNQEEFRVSLKNEVFNLLQQITAEKRALNRERQPTNQNNLDYISPLRQDFEILDTYEGIGNHINQSKPEGSFILGTNYAILYEMPEIARQTSEYIKRNPDEKTLSFIVCDSSGTGKTQLPFTLKIPLLFFSISTFSQPIYGLFEAVSTHLIILLDEDFKTFESWLKNYTEAETDPEGFHSLKYFSTSNIKRVAFKTPSFLIGLIREIIAIQEIYPNDLWPRLQLNIRNRIQVEDLTFNEFAQRREELLNRTKPKPGSDSGEQVPVLSQLPLIFLDEFNLEPSPKGRAKYAFYRNIIRCCGLIPVLMGTNSKIANLITSARGGTGTSTLAWTYVFYKLPPYPLGLLESKLEELTVKLNRSTLDFPVNSLVGLLFELLPKERPFFVNAVMTRLLRLADSESILLANLFDSIFEAIEIDFTERKRGYMDFYYLHQYFFMDFAYFKVFDLKDEDELNAITGHLAHLVPPIDCLNFHFEAPDQDTAANDSSYFEIYRQIDYPKYRKRGASPGEFSNYTPDSAFDFFYDTPLSGMALAGRNPFRKGTSFITAFEAIIESRKPDERTGKGRTPRRALDSNALEYIVNLSFLAASYQNGIRGQSFENWFQYFIQNLACSNPILQAPGNPKLINLSKYFPFEDEIIPVVAFNYSQWHPRLREFFSQNGIDFGVFTGARYNSTDLIASRTSHSKVSSPSINITSDPLHELSSQKHTSFFVTESPLISQEKQLRHPELNFMSIECKLQKAPHSPAKIVEFMIHMMNQKTNSKFNLIVFHRIASYSDILFECSLYDDILANSSIFYLRRHDTNASFQNESRCAYLTADYFYLSLLKAVRKEECRNVFILVSLEEIHGPHLMMELMKNMHK